MFFDDGFVMYVNGVEVARVNMPAAPAAIAYTTLATAAVEGDAELKPTDVFFGNDLIKNGRNVIAVEVRVCYVVAALWRAR